MTSRQLAFGEESTEFPVSARDYGTDPLLPPEGPLIAPGRMASAEAIPPAVLDRLRGLLEAATYRFAWTMRWNPHWYTLRKTWVADEDAAWAPDGDFTWVVATILRYGYRAKFGKRWYGQIDVGDHFYWTMGWPAEETELINRKPIPGDAAGAAPTTDHDGGTR